MSNKLIMLVGVASSGKSTLANILLKEEYIDTIVSSDAVRAELYGNENDQTHNKEVFEEVYRRIRTFLKEGKNVCYDATNLSCKRRMNFLKQLKDLDIEKECIVVMTSFDDCIMRQSHRTRQVPEGVIRGQIKKFQCPYWYEGWDNILIHHTSHVPLIWFMEQNNINHDNSHHTLNIKEHMEKAAAVYKENYYQWPEVYEAVLYHDLGKYFCKQFFLSNGKPDSQAHYYGHQNASAYFYLLDVHVFDINGLNKALYIACLIQWHMEYLIRNEKGIQNLEEMLGENMVRDLKHLCGCDKLAH